MIIDTHSHLYLDAFAEDREQVMARARQAGVEKVLLPAIDSSHHDEIKHLVDEFPQYFAPMMGVHPCSVQPGSWQRELEVAEQLLDSGKYCAVGEIGIDLHWDKTTLGIQIEAFKTQINWAKSRKLPIVIHCREAFDEIFEVLDELNDDDLFGVFHCFTGNLGQAQHIINYGQFLLGIGGVLTFKNSGLDKVMKDVDLQHIVLETDAPYLAPAPHRGKRNESAYVALVLEKLAEIKEMKSEEVARITTTNAVKMFQL